MCGHSAAWHTSESGLNEAERIFYAFSDLATPGYACDLCDCKGYVRPMLFAQVQQGGRV